MSGADIIKFTDLRWGDHPSLYGILNLIIWALKAENFLQLEAEKTWHKGSSDRVWEGERLLI